MEKDKNHKKISRREALKYIGVGTIGFVATTSGLSLLSSCKGKTTAQGNSSLSTSHEGINGMTLRSVGNMNEKVSLLGFGCMRFPTNEDKSINEELSLEMIDYAYKNGVNYFDTAWPYHGGESETFTGKALKRYPRESFYLASKMPTWAVKNAADAKTTFEKQLEKCQVDYFDFYMLHSLSSQKTYDSVYEEGGVYEYLVGEKKAGRIGKLGFSFHGDLDLFKYLLAKHDWDFVQIQLNYYDWDDAKEQSGTLYGLLEERKIPVIVMEPIRGGMLARLTPDSEAILRAAEPDKSAASWALRFAASPQGVLTVLSGMSAMEHVVDNVKTMQNFKPLTDDERKVLSNSLRIFMQTKPIRCTDCKYCMPCEFGVDIPKNFMFYNTCINESMVPDIGNPTGEEFEKRKKTFLERYNAIPESERSNKCEHCNVCVSKCPQKIQIPTELDRITKIVAALEK